MLTIQNVFKSYDGKKQALNGVSLILEPGDLFGFVGPNGAGKTTLLKCIAGILNVDRGTIVLDGDTIQQQPIRFKSKLAYIPDHPQLYEGLTGIQFIHFVADAFKIPMALRQSRIDQYLQMFDMKVAIDQAIGTYSHGMKQKTALMAALVHQPKLMLLDEPFVGLDPKAAFQLKQVFKASTAGGTTILFSSHILEVVEKLTNKIAIIKQGNIVKVGNTNEVLKDQSLENLFMELVD